MIEIRPASPDDIPLLGDVEREAAQLFRGTHVSWVADSAPLPCAVLDRACERGQLWVASGNGELAGFALVGDTSGA